MGVSHKQSQVDTGAGYTAASRCKYTQSRRQIRGNHTPCSAHKDDAALGRNQKVVPNPKGVLDKESVKVALAAGERITRTWARQHAGIAKALRLLTWKRVHRMEGVTAYQKQNIVKLKLHRMRLWAGRDTGFQCAREGCVSSGEGGEGHLIWICPDAQRFWRMMRNAWGKGKEQHRNKDELGDEIVQDIFSFILQHVPRWLTDWGAGREKETGGMLFQVSTEM